MCNSIASRQLWFSEEVAVPAESSTASDPLGLDYEVVILLKMLHLTVAVQDKTDEVFARALLVTEASLLISRLSA